MSGRASADCMRPDQVITKPQPPNVSSHLVVQCDGATSLRRSDGGAGVCLPRGGCVKGTGTITAVTRGDVQGASGTMLCTTHSHCNTRCHSSLSPRWPRENTPRRSTLINLAGTAAGRCGEAGGARARLQSACERIESQHNQLYEQMLNKCTLDTCMGGAMGATGWYGHGAGHSIQAVEAPQGQPNPRPARVLLYSMAGTTSHR
jgi:hypothetical protein